MTVLRLLPLLWTVCAIANFLLVSRIFGDQSRMSLSDIVFAVSLVLLGPIGFLIILWAEGDRVFIWEKKKSPAKPGVKREKHFMIDIETTGIDPKENDLLQIGIVEMDFKNGFWYPGKSFELIQHSPKQPESEFAKEHMKALYKTCNRAKPISVEEVRGRMLEFFRSCGAKPPYVYFAGWNASNFDIPFLVHHGYLVPNKYVMDEKGKDRMVGDFHYRIYEMGGALSLAQDVFQYEGRNDTIEKLANLDPIVSLPKGKEHDAIYDCYKQMKILNGLIIAMRRGTL